MDAGRGLNGAVYWVVAASSSGGGDDGHLDVGGVPGSSHDIEVAFAHGFKVELPLANASSDYDAGNSVLTMIGVDQIGVTTIGQALVRCESLAPFFRDLRSLRMLAGTSFWPTAWCSTAFDRRHR